MSGYTDTDVTALAELLTEAHQRGMRAGGFTLARFILDAGYRRAQPELGEAREAPSNDLQTAPEGSV